MQDGEDIIKKYAKAIFIVLLVITLSFFSTTIGHSYPIEKWNKTYGGKGYDVATQVIQTIDGGYAFVGITDSFGSGEYDFWLVKTDKNGTMEWNKLYGGSRDDSAYDLLQTDDDGYLIVGSSNSPLVGGNDYDFLLIKTNSTGGVEWYKTYGGIKDDQATSVTKTPDGGYAIAGISNSFGEEKNNFILIKIYSNGDLCWSKTYGGPEDDFAYSLIQTQDYGFALAGYTLSYGSGSSDFWLVKTDQNGTMEWNRTYGGKQDDGAYSLIQTQDYGFALAGYTLSYGSGSSDFWLVKTDQNGTMEWNRTYGGKQDDGAYSLIQTPDNGFAIAGHSEVLLSYDFFLVKTDSNGYMQWNKNYSGDGDERALSLIRTDGGGFTLVGYTQWPNGYNVFMIKTNKDISDEINLSPMAYAGGDANVHEGKIVSFNGTGYDPDGKITIFRWDFNGDGIYDWNSNSTGITTYIYNKEGSYNAFLEIFDNNGSSSIDLRKIIVTSDQAGITSNKMPQGIGALIFIILLGISIIIVYNIKTIRQILNRSKCLHFFMKLGGWFGLIILSFFVLIAVKFLISYFFVAPRIYGDELIYGVLAKYIFQGNFTIIGNVPFSTAYPPAGYSYFLAPTYLLGNNMDVVYRAMLFINCVLSSLVIFPVFFIMKNFVSKKLSFVTSIIIAILPIITAYTYVTMSENAFYPIFLISCLLILKTFTCDNFDKKFVFYSLLSGFSVGFLIMVRSIGVAMLAALFFVFLYKIIKNRKIFAIKYGLIFLPFIPVIGYMMYKSKSLTMGYSDSYYLANLSLVFSNLSNFTRFIHIVLNEINYFVVMSYIVFAAFSVFLVINWKKFQNEKKESLAVFTLYGLSSIFFLIIITSTHIFSTHYSIYTRYASPGLPIIFMLGVIGINLFQRIKNKNRNVNFHISYILILLGFFFILFFPIENYHIVNNIDLLWITGLRGNYIFNVDCFTLFRILFGVILILFTICITLKWFLKKNFSFIKKSSKSANIFLIVALLLSLLLCIPIIDEQISENAFVMNDGMNKPARWFMQNDPDSSIIFEDGFGAFSGGGMDLSYWKIMHSDMYFWLPDAHVEFKNSNNLSNLILSGNVNADYILSTHDLTQYYPSVADIYMHISANPIKKQVEVDWHIYKVK